jgi:hypothetical protein
MQGREFLKPARTLAAQKSEADWRGAAVHAYYAIFLECRDALRRWGRLPVGRHNVHPAVRLKLTYTANVDLKQLADVLEKLADLRSRASYNLGWLSQFQTDLAAWDAIKKASDAIVLLDAIEADPARRAAAIASVPP